LLDALVEAFEDEYSYDVKPIVQGSGQILELARNGELDVVMTHSPGAQQALLHEGIGLERSPMMQNYFQLVGPAHDPAGVGAAQNMQEAFRRIAEARSTFVSRGDESGTHLRELSYWEGTGVDPAREPWYTETGTGQGQTLIVAGDSGAYTLVDSSTFGAFQGNTGLTLLLRDENSPNVYSVTRLNGQRLEDVNEAAGDAWLEFIWSDAGQAVIRDFGREEYGESLFEPLLLN
jgi:tungstate transport system substrate-binding protein